MRIKLPGVGGGGGAADIPIINEVKSQDALLNYNSQYLASKEAVDKRSVFTETLPGIILFHQGLYKDGTDAEGRKFKEQFSAKGVNVETASKKITAPYITTPYNACKITPADCKNNMADYTIPLDRIRKSDTLSYAKTGVSPIPGFHDVKYKDDILDQAGDDFTISDDALKSCAAQNNFCQTDSSALHYIVYSPINVDYTYCKLPGIILFHAGGYSDCSNYKYEDSLCYALARKGFIVYLVEYRRGRIKDTYDNGIYTADQQFIAIYRAWQDGRGAIRSIIKRQRNIAYNHLPYQLDTNSIFVAGQSAGAGIANSLAYYRNQTMVNSVFPVPAGEIPIQNSLGDIDADYYYGTPDIEYQSKIKGLWSMWGGFPIPVVNGVSVNAYNFLSNNGNYTLIPMIGVMGRYDNVFPLQEPKQYIYFPPQNDPVHFPYTTETFCLNYSPFKIYDNIHPPIKQLRIMCTLDIYNIFKAHNISALEYFDCFMGHGLEHVQGGDICSTDFGSNIPITLNQVNEYLASRACFYFQSILNLNEQNLLGASIFRDCIDKRHSDGSGDCAINPDNDSCDDADVCKKKQDL